MFEFELKIIIAFNKECVPIYLIAKIFYENFFCHKMFFQWIGLNLLLGLLSEKPKSVDKPSQFPIFEKN